jgi:hypothetical protein
MGNDWDVSKPINHTKIGDVPQEIRDVKSSTKHVILKEHVTPGTDNAGGQHLLGSTRVYLESTEPVVDPEGNSLATADTTDDGRIAVLTGSVNLLKVYVATAAGPTTGWEDVTVGKVAAAADLDANGNNVINVATGTQSGQAIHVGQMDTAYFQGISTGLIQSRLISTYLAASGQDGIVVLSSRSDADRVQGSGTTVFNTTMTAANTFQDLDISSVVGANVAFVLLEITSDAASYIAVKPKDGGGAAAAHFNTPDTPNGAGAASCTLTSASEYRQLVTATNSSGILEICGGNNTTTWTIKVTHFAK